QVAAGDGADHDRQGDLQLQVSLSVVGEAAHEGGGDDDEEGRAHGDGHGHMKDLIEDWNDDDAAADTQEAAQGAGGQAEGDEGQDVHGGPSFLTVLGQVRACPERYRTIK